MRPCPAARRKAGRVAWWKAVGKGGVVRRCLVMVVVVVDFVVDGVMVLLLWVVGGGRVKGEPRWRFGRIGFLLIDSFPFFPFLSPSDGGAFWSNAG